MKPTPKEMAFIDHLFLNGFNKMAAYQAVNPNSAKNTAKSACHMYMKKPAIIAEIERRQAIKSDVAVKAAIASKDYLISEAHEIGKEARAEKKHQVALNAVEVKAKLNNVYDKDKDDAGQYMRLFQSLTIKGDLNIYNTGEQQKTIDIAAYDKHQHSEQDS